MGYLSYSCLTVKFLHFASILSKILNVSVNTSTIAWDIYIKCAGNLEVVYNTLLTHPQRNLKTTISLIYSLSTHQQFFFR